MHTCSRLSDQLDRDKFQVFRTTSGIESVTIIYNLAEMATGPEVGWITSDHTSIVCEHHQRKFWGVPKMSINWWIHKLIELSPHLAAHRIHGKQYFTCLHCTHIPLNVFNWNRSEAISRVSWREKKTTFPKMTTWNLGTEMWGKIS